MKACEEYIEKIVLSLDGGLSKQEEIALQGHLAVCEGCRCLYETYRNIDTGILGTEEEPPEGLTRSVMQEIRLEKEKSRPMYHLKRMKFSLTALAACLILVVAGRFVPASSETEPATAAQVPETMAVEPELIEDTAWMPVYDEQEAAEEAATMEEIPTEGAETETAALDEMMDRSVDGAFEGVKAVLEALNRDGYRGDLVELLDMTEEDIYETFSSVETLLISSGDRVYQVSWEQFDAVEAEMNYGTVVSTDEVGEWVYLWIG